MMEKVGNPNTYARRSETAVILHLFYADLWPEICRHLEHIPGGYDLYVTIPNVQGDMVENHILSDVPGANVFRLPNRGRDIAPFIETLGRISSLGYSQICKIHSKKSLHSFGGNRWRANLYKTLLGSEETMKKVFSAFDRYPAIGIIGAAPYLFDYKTCSLLNSDKVDNLSEKMGLQIRDMRFSFFAGSMFWFRPDALGALMDLGLTADDFEPEAGQLDGTMAHAIERIFLLAASSRGYVTITTKDLATERLALVAVSDPLAFQTGKKCYKSILTRGVLTRKFVMKVRSWIAASRA